MAPGGLAGGVRGTDVRGTTGRANSHRGPLPRAKSHRGPLPGVKSHRGPLPKAKISMAILFFFRFFQGPKTTQNERARGEWIIVDNRAGPYRVGNTGGATAITQYKSYKAGI